VGMRWGWGGVAELPIDKVDNTKYVLTFWYV
jgi:hypothetical protein